MGIDMSKEFRPNKSYNAWGPFVSDDYVIQPVTYRSIVTAGIIFGLACIFALSASYIGYRQTRAARRPWKSLYIWMIWMEIAASVVIAIECLLFLLKVIRPSFWFYMSILLNWSIQIQLLLQIIVNRIRIILSDPRKGHRLMLGTVVIVGIINVSVFIIWIPARLQISETWIRINNGWDRTEKVLYLVVDALLNYYFIRVVKQNLIDHGLEKYNTLVRFNQYMIVISLLMDVMIIGAMSFPNGFVYAMFHPLAYLVKLNIEMSMAHLIKTIALDRSRSSGNMSYFFAFPSPPSTDAKNNPSQASGSSTQQVSIFHSFFGKESNRNSWNIEDQGQHDRFTYAQRPISPHTRPPRVHQDSLSWVDQDDNVGSDSSGWVRSDSAHKDLIGRIESLRPSNDDEILLHRPEPAVLAPKGPEIV